jgi:hypothetical protein
MFAILRYDLQLNDYSSLFTDATLGIQVAELDADDSKTHDTQVIQAVKQAVDDEMNRITLNGTSGSDCDGSCPKDWFIIGFEDVDFKGNRTLMTGREAVSARCGILSHDWDDRISSLNMRGLCAIFYVNKNCSGPGFMVTTASIPDLTPFGTSIAFNDNIASYRPCPHV